LIAVAVMHAMSPSPLGHHTQPISSVKRTWEETRELSNKPTRFPGSVKRRLGVTGRAILAGACQTAIGEAGFFEHCEEDLPRHGAGNSVGPGRLVRRRPVTDQPDVACLKPTAGTQDPEDL
jgi:hypothetical protein